MEDDLVCEYDSTWDTESDGDDLGDNTSRRSSQDKSKKTRPFWPNSSSRNMRAAKDMQNYRHGYPNINEEECAEVRMTNLKFYLNEITSSPDDVTIEVFHKEWKTDYKRLERVHSYIQWLFPLREPGVNYMALELTKKEIQAFRDSEEAKRRLVDSYELMLGFYGIQLLSRESGEVKRADNWRERFANLERNMHNNLRITRILKSLGELGFEHYQAPLVRFFLEETLVRKNLNSVKRSVLDYFLFAVRDKRERRKLIRFAFQHYEPKDKFVWCPRKIQKRLKKKSEKKQDSGGSESGAAPEDARSWTKAKEKDGGKEVKEAKALEEVTEPVRQSEDDATMSVDAEQQGQGSAVDQEPPAETPSLDPVPHGKANGIDNEEMEQTSSAEFSVPEAHDGKEDKHLGSRQAEAEVPVEIEDIHDPEITNVEQEKPNETKRNGDVAKVGNGPTELPKCPAEIKTTPNKESSSMSNSERTVDESPKHISPLHLQNERAEKQPRTDFSSSPSHLATESKEAPVEMSVGCVESQEDTDGLRENHTNGRKCDEPMDVESSK